MTAIKLLPSDKYTLMGEEVKCSGCYCNKCIAAMDERGMHSFSEVLAEPYQGCGTYRLLIQTDGRHAWGYQVLDNGDILRCILNGCGSPVGWSVTDLTVHDLQVVES